MPKIRKPPAQEHDTRALNIMADPRLSQGVYSNLAIIRHTKLEFICDFLLVVDNDAQLVARVLLSPDHARRLTDALEQNLRKYAAANPSAGASG